MVASTEVGLTEAQWQATGESTRSALRAQARESLADGQPDFHVDTVGDLPAAIEQIEARLSAAPL